LKTEPLDGHTYNNYKRDILRNKWKHFMLFVANKPTFTCKKEPSIGLYSQPNDSGAHF